MNFVSIIVPCYNEEKSISFLLTALYRQNYQKDSMEIIIVDGLSTDNTIKEISSFAEVHPDLNIRVIPNSKKIIPAAINLGILNSNGEIIVRMDAHSVPDQDYIKYCVENLKNNIAANVGGKWQIIPGSESLIAKCISLAAGHPFGVGDAKYRYSQTAEYVDTVPFGAFYKSLTDEIGLFNEELLANEDYEFNVRIRNSGKKIYFDPKITTKYIARENWVDLAKQYWRYGYWKFKMLKNYPDTLRWRQAIPPVFVAGIIFLLLLALFSSTAFILISIILSVYIFVLVLGTLFSIKKTKNFLCIFGVPISIMVMHFSWGLGFIYSFFSGLGKK